MAVKVIQGKVYDGVNYYIKGEIIAGLSKTEEARLVSLGVAELVPEVKKSKEVNPYAGKNAEEMIAIIESMDNEEDLKAVFENEQQGKNRKTIFQAIAVRMESLNKKDQGTDGQDPDGQNGEGTKIDFNPDELIK